MRRAPVCGSCGTINVPSAQKCVNCGGLLSITAPLLPRRYFSLRRKKLLPLFFLLIILSIIVLLVGSILVFVLPKLNTPVVPTGIGIFKSLHTGDTIGISDGRYAFDTYPGRLDSDFKSEATTLFNHNNQDLVAATTKMDQAINADSSDAEALIYKENWHVLSLHKKYITIVIACIIGSNPADASSGREDLQCAYIAQKEYNDGFKLNAQVRLVVANSGPNVSDASTIAQKIVALQASDPTFVGVEGWSYSTLTRAAVNILHKAHIPMVSGTSSSDKLTHISPYFFRVAPPDKDQGVFGAKYAEKVLNANTAALFVDNNDLYSSSLANDFKTQFEADGKTIVATEHYIAQKPELLPDLLTDALKYKPDMLYFSGYASDISALLTDLPPGTMPVMGGDSLYSLGQYTTGSRPGFLRLHFTSFAFPDEWDVEGLTTQTPYFFSAYPHTYDPLKLHTQDPYGYDRADYGVILSYDATLAILYACHLVLKQNSTLTPEHVRSGLAAIHGDNTLQGASGQIAFDPDGNPIDKVVLVLSVDKDGHIHMEPTIQGSLLSPTGQNP